MIGSLRGTLLDRDAAGELLIESGGVGYRVTVGPPTLAAAGAVGGECFVYVRQHVREDSITLYGFGSLDERRCFEALLGAHGVGPALALAVLSRLPPDELRTAVASDDADALELVPGIGAKTSKRMILDLKGKLGEFDSAADVAVVPGTGAVSAVAEVRAALRQMGFGAAEIRHAVSGLGAQESDDVSVLLRAALQRLGSR